MPSVRSSFACATHNVAETEAFGVRIGRLLTAPMCIALRGPLGAGKTAWTRGLVDGVQAGEGAYVASPTYNVCHVYETDPVVYHYDLYRLEGEEDLESVGFYDTVDAGILIIEWAERIPSIDAYIDLELLIVSPSEGNRDFTLVARSPRGRLVIDALSQI